MPEAAVGKPKRETNVKDLGFALILRGEFDLVDSVKPALHAMGISTWNCRSCEELASLLEQTEPQLVFTDSDLPDGTWLRVMRVIQNAKCRVNVFVVGKEPNTRMEDLVRECGGYRYLTTQFERELFQAEVRCAVEEVYERRGATAMDAA